MDFIFIGTLLSCGRFICFLVKEIILENSRLILIIFVCTKILIYLVERFLGHINRKYYLNQDNQERALKILSIPRSELDKSLSYAKDKYIFSYYSNVVGLTLLLVFIILGGLGYCESLVESWFDSLLFQGLGFFAIIGILSFIIELPFSYYETFVVEQKHGFNTQTPKGFWIDTIKGLVVSTILMGLILVVVLSIMNRAGTYWWIWGFIAVTLISLITTWLYPVLLAPIFNKFTPLDEGSLKTSILELASKINFPTDGIFVMDASKRSTHGNAYFTGIFKKKRIVLFDTILKDLTDDQIVAVLGHELGHFKLHHVRKNLIKSFIISFITFYLISLTVNFREFYLAFGFSGTSAYATLTVFGLWFSMVNFLLVPIANWFSRRDEFKADSFACECGPDFSSNLSQALLKLTTTNKSVPIVHPWYSFVYFSHPQLIERLSKIKEHSSK